MKRFQRVKMTVSGSGRGRIGAKTLMVFVLGAFCFFSTFSIAGTQTALAIAVLLWAILSLLRKIEPPRRTALDVPIAMFIAAALAAAFLSERPIASLANLKNMPLVGIVYLLGWTLESKREARMCFVALLVSGAASSLYGIVVFLTERGEGTLGRTPGPFSTAMTFGGVLLFLCSLFLAVGIGGGLSRRMRFTALLSALLAAVALFFSFTRSSWLGMTAAAVTIVSVMRRRLLIVVAIVIIAAVLILPAPYRARVTSIWDPNYRTNVQRFEMLRGGWEMFKDHPWFGVGTMDLADTYRRYMPPGAVHVHGHLHNIFLQVAATMGIVGLALFCYLIYAFFKLMIGNVRRSLDHPERAWVIGSLGAFVGFIVNGLFEWNFGDAEVVTLLYVVVGANLAFSMREERFAVSFPPPGGHVQGRRRERGG
jgi:O-antigen ligase